MQPTYHKMLHSFLSSTYIHGEAGRWISGPDADNILFCFCFFFFPAAAKAEDNEEVTTVSGKMDADKGEKKTKEGKKEGKVPRERKGDEKDASTKKKTEKGTPTKEGAEGKGKKSTEKGAISEKGGKNGPKGGAKKANKWSLWTHKMIISHSGVLFCPPPKKNFVYLK